MMERIKVIDSFWLKIIAIIIMTIDHVGAIMFPYNYDLRIIGRIAFPIFAFMIVEGITHTRNIQKYLTRLGIFALVSEIPYDYGFRGVLLEFHHQNILFTLLLGALAIYFFRQYQQPCIQFMVGIACCYMAELLYTDYGPAGVAMIIALYIFRGNLWGILGTLIYFNVFAYGGIQKYAVLAFIPIALYNGKKGHSMKYFFYAYYPVHILVIALLTNVLSF